MSVLSLKCFVYGVDEYKVAFAKASVHIFNDKKNMLELDFSSDYSIIGRFLLMEPYLKRFKNNIVSIKLGRITENLQKNAELLNMLSSGLKKIHLLNCNPQILSYCVDLNLEMIEFESCDVDDTCSGVYTFLAKQHNLKRFHYMSRGFNLNPYNIVESIKKHLIEDFKVDYFPIKSFLCLFNTSTHCIKNLSIYVDEAKSFTTLCKLMHSNMPKIIKLTLCCNCDQTMTDINSLFTSDQLESLTVIEGSLDIHLVEDFGVSLSTNTTIKSLNFENLCLSARFNDYFDKFVINNRHFDKLEIISCVNYSDEKLFESLGKSTVTSLLLHNESNTFEEYVCNFRCKLLITSKC